MTIVTTKPAITLWQELIKTAEQRCDITLDHELETYLIALLMRYTNQPEIAKQVFAKAFLAALQARQQVRAVSLQHVGDQCLLYAGLFPFAAEKKHVKISYFVHLGQAAYAAISHTANDLYWSLALQFVMLMDVLQSLRETPALLPLQAYEQWNDVGSLRALKTLKTYTVAVPLKNFRR